MVTGHGKSATLFAINVVYLFLYITWFSFIGFAFSLKAALFASGGKGIFHPLTPEVSSTDRHIAFFLYVKTFDRRRYDYVPWQCNGWSCPGFVDSLLSRFSVWYFIFKWIWTQAPHNEYAVDMSYKITRYIQKYRNEPYFCWDIFSDKPPLFLMKQKSFPSKHCPSSRRLDS